MDNQMAKPGRILITGGRGLIAGRVAEHLASEECRVYLGSRNLQAESITWPNNVETVHIDWQDEDSLRKACDGVDVVINAMGMNAGDCALDPVSSLIVNGVYTSLLLRAAVAADAKRFIHVSTAHVYSSHLHGTICESTCPTNLHPYATSHRSGEDAVLWADQRGDIEGIVLRLSNAYGRPLNPGTGCWTLLVNDLCRQAVEKKGLTLHSDGLQFRDFVPLSRVCWLIRQLCEVDSVALVKKEGCVSSVFNVGSGVSTSVLSMAELIQTRCECMLGYSVTLAKQVSHKKGEDAVLHYKSENLAQSLIVSREDSLTEIDDLLLFCRKHFQE